MYMNNNSAAMMFILNADHGKWKFVSREIIEKNMDSGLFSDYIIEKVITEEKATGKKYSYGVKYYRGAHVSMEIHFTNAVDDPEDGYKVVLQDADD